MRDRIAKKTTKTWRSRHVLICSPNNPTTWKPAVPQNSCESSCLTKIGTNSSVFQVHGILDTWFFIRSIDLPVSSHDIHDSNVSLSLRLWTDHQEFQISKNGGFPSHLISGYCGGLGFPSLKPYIHTAHYFGEDSEPMAPTKRPLKWARRKWTPPLTMSKAVMKSRTGKTLFLWWFGSASNPIGSMENGIFIYIYHKNQPNVGKYTSPMDPRELKNLQNFSGIFRDHQGHGTPLW